MQYLKNDNINVKEIYCDTINDSNIENNNNINFAFLSNLDDNFITVKHYHPKYKYHDCKRA